MLSREAAKQFRAAAPIFIAILFLLLVVSAFLYVRHLMCGTQSKEGALAARLDEQHYPNVRPDFFRVSFLPLDTNVDTLGRKGVATRAFFAASSDFVHGMPLAEMVTYPGAGDDPNKKLVAMRCKPADLSAVDPILATWPNVFQAITRDFADMKFSCPPKAASTNGTSAEANKAETNKFFCAAQAFQDSAGDNATVVLSKALDAAAVLTFDDQTKQRDAKAKDWLKDTYGI